MGGGARCGSLSIFIRDLVDPRTVARRVVAIRAYHRAGARLGGNLYPQDRERIIKIIALFHTSPALRSCVAFHAPFPTRGL